MDVALKDTPHTQIGDDMASQRAATTLDLALCNVVSIHMAMNEFEKAMGLRFDQWPEAIRMRMAKEIADWQARNPDATIKAITQGVENGVCVLALHWRPKGLKPKDLLP